MRGISRQYVFELCDQLGIKWVEKNIELYDVLTADEAFVTATPFCILPATKVNGLDIGNAKYGGITKQLLDTWSENVGMDIEQQIRTYSTMVDQENTKSAYQLEYESK